MTTFTRCRHILKTVKNVTVAKFEYAMSEQFENGRNLTVKYSLQDFDAKKMYLHSKNRAVSFQRPRKMFCFHVFIIFECSHDAVSRMCQLEFHFSKSTVFEIYRRKMCRFRVNVRPNPPPPRFPNVPASCERCLYLLGRFRMGKIRVL